MRDNFGRFTKGHIHSENWKKAMINKIPWNKNKTGIYSEKTLKIMGEKSKQRIRSEKEKSRMRSLSLQYGFKKGHPNYNKNPSKGWKHTKKWKLFMHKKMKDKIRPQFSKKWIDNISKSQKKRFEFSRPEDHPQWKGGLPNCVVCGKKLSNRKAIYCFKHPPPLTKEARQKISDKLRGRMPKNLLYNKKYASGKYNINGKRIFFRSKWEANYALYLDLLIEQKYIKKWEYEKDVFIFEKIKFGTRSYRPDFKVYNNDTSIEYHEIKGWMDKKSRTKLNRMRIYYPQIRLRLIRKEEYTLLKKQVGALLKFY